MARFKEILIKILGYICVVLFIMMTVVGTYQVAARYLFTNPKAWTEELLTYGFTWMALFATVLVFGKREHMRFTFFVEKLEGGKRRNIEIINELLIMVFATVILIFGGFTICRLTMSQVTPALQFKMGLVYSIIPISGIIIDIFSIINIQEIKNTNYTKISKEVEK